MDAKHGAVSLQAIKNAEGWVQRETDGFLNAARVSCVQPPVSREGTSMSMTTPMFRRRFGLVFV